MSKNRIIPLSEIGEIITGNTPKTSDTENYESNDIPFLKPSDFSTDNIDLFDTEFYISEKARNKARVLPVGSIVVTCIGIIGKTKITQKECAFNQQINAIIPFDGNNNRYIAYAISFQKELLQTKANAAVVPIINKTEFSKISIPLPTLETQRKIASNLDKVTHTIDLCNAILEKLDLLVKSRFVEMFGDPETNPKRWRKLPLSDIIINANNGMARRGNDSDGNIVLRLVELQDGYIDYSNPNKIELSEAEKKRYHLIDKDFLFARVNGNPDNVGRCAVFYDIGEPVFHNDHIIRVHFDETLLDGCFASSLFNSIYGKLQMKAQIKTSAGQYTISQDGIGAIVSILPPLDLQQQFAAFVEQTDKSKSAVKQVLEKAETLKKALMQEYFG